jgi:hypothetical protein
LEPGLFFLKQPLKLVAPTLIEPRDLVVMDISSPPSLKNFFFELQQLTVVIWRGKRGCRYGAVAPAPAVAAASNLANCRRVVV